MATARNIGWCLVVALMGLLMTQAFLWGILSVATGHWFGPFDGPVGVLSTYWIGAGAWRRTTWGRVTVDTESLGPILDETHSRRLILLAAAVPVVLALALGLQVV